jgi:SAM-dependent methyltransferase
LNSDFLEFFELNGQPGRIDGDTLRFGDVAIPIRNGIPRFTPDMSYSSGNFSTLRERHSELQLDSRNGTTDRLDTLLSRTGWPAEFFQGKTVLECGCGAGPDTEILRSLGARVLSADLAGLDVAKRNLGDPEDVQFVQASILDLPLRKQSFDIVFCHRVIQHTPDPLGVLEHILQFVKPDGAAFVHSYARSPMQLLRWKYWLRPFTRRMDSESLYHAIERWSPLMYRITSFTNRTRWGRRFAHVFIPFFNYRHLPQFRGMSDDAIREYGVHDTFDALAPAYDSPLSARQMRDVAARHLKRPFEVHEHPMITLLRTRVAPAASPALVPAS